MTHELRLDDCPHVRVFRVACAAILEDPVLTGLVRRWRTWDGRRDDWREPAHGEFPCVELLVGEGPDQFYTPDGFIGQLIVDVIVTCLGSDQADPLNLYWAIRRAIYPINWDARLALHDDLVAAGAEGPFLVQFAAPRFMPVREDGEGQFSGRLVGYGGFSVNVVERLNP